MANENCCRGSSEGSGSGNNGINISQINTVPRLHSVANNRDNWHDKETRFKWQMDKNDRQAALAKCGVYN